MHTLWRCWCGLWRWKMNHSMCYQCYCDMTDTYIVSIFKWFDIQGSYELRFVSCIYLHSKISHRKVDLVQHANTAVNQIQQSILVQMHLHHCPKEKTLIQCILFATAPLCKPKADYSTILCMAYSRSNSSQALRAWLLALGRKMNHFHQCLPE